MMEPDPFKTQRDAGLAVGMELSAAGFDDPDEIGRGGFGIVYRCGQAGLDRAVAVKVLTAELDENRERFLREQRAMGRLTGHPNIVGVLQVGETESGHPYLVMQYHRQGSLEARIRRLGPLGLDEVLRLGVKMAGALATAHRFGVIHRDVKPGNILWTEYGEPALSDFGIAHISGGFKTATGTFTGSPAFTAPEILSGDPPTEASDVYGLGATLFCTLTGHAAFERRSGEQVVTQFLRIATESAPDLRESGIPDDVSSVIEKAMCRDPNGRPTVIELAEELRRVQASHGFCVDEMALRGEAMDVAEPRRVAAVVRSPRGNIPVELTSFVGRRAELSELKKLLSTSRLVTLTGLGGVGKTRLALRVAAELRQDFADGVWLIELDELRDGSLLVEVVAAGLGLRDDSARPLLEKLVDFLSPRDMLLVLDNCEQVVDAAAQLTSALLRGCPDLRIVTTSRERLGVGGESEVRLSPLALPDADSEPTLGGLPEYDAVALFTERAASAVPGFMLTNENKATVARICHQLDGLPLAIELAAARLRAMSLEQISDRLSDRYALLTRGSRGAPNRQQTLRWSVGWSYDLCSPDEQQLWSRLSVFAGSFDLEAAEDICSGEWPSEQFLDLLSSLVDKSILNRIESERAVRFRLLDTLRDFGREQIRQAGAYVDLRRRHLDWYRRLANETAAEWFGPRQLDWIERVGREMPNLREALEFGLQHSPETAVEIAAAMHPVWIARGMLSEGRRWLDRALATAVAEPGRERVMALYGAAMISALQGDTSAEAARVTAMGALVEQMTDPVARGLFVIADGFKSLVTDEFDRACTCLEDAIDASDDPMVRLLAMAFLGWAHEFRGDPQAATDWVERALAFAESRDESVYRSYAMWSAGIVQLRHGEVDRAAETLGECLRLAHRLNDPRNVATCLEGLAWIAGVRHNPQFAVTLMAAAESLGLAAGSGSTVVFPALLGHHEDCERSAREALSEEQFETADLKGRSLDFDEAVAYALGG
jgi:predicted ATPase